jgi:hypothetical protein
LGDENPTLNIIRGYKYIFNINAPGHPFWIQTDEGYDPDYEYRSGITGNGTESGQLIWEVSLDAPDSLFYQCQYHRSMVGSINVSDFGPQGPLGPTGPAGPTGAPVMVSETAPENPSSGDFWLRVASGALYVYYVDETSGQWVQVG